MKLTTTSREFELIEFEDDNGAACSLQQSSSIGFGDQPPGGSNIWLGPNSASPKRLILNEGWVDAPLPDGVETSTRMHLDRDNVAELVGYLNRWLKTGSFRRRRHIRQEATIRKEAHREP